MRRMPDDVSDKQVKQTLHRVRATFDACDFHYPADIDADDVAHALPTVAVCRGITAACPSSRATTTRRR